MLAGGARIAAELGANGWFEPGSNPAARRVPAHGSLPTGDSGQFATVNPGMLRPQEARAVTFEDGAGGPVMRVLEHPALHKVFEVLFGEPAITMDYKWFRAVAPGRCGPTAAAFVNVDVPMHSFPERFE